MVEIGAKQEDICFKFKFSPVNGLTHSTLRQFSDTN